MSYGDDIKFYLRIARRRLGYFLLPLALVAALGTAIVLKLPAIYSSSAKILVESQQIPDDFVKSTVTALATERLQVIQQRVLTRENLLRIAEKFKLFANRKSLSKTDLVDLIQSRITFQIIDLGTTTRHRGKQENLTVAFSIGFEYERPSIAAQVANELVTIVLNEDIQSRNARATETTNFLARESERLGNELRDIDAKIADFKLKNSDTLPEKLSFNMSLLERQRTQVSEIDRDLRAADDSRRLLQFEATVRSSQQGSVAGGAKTPQTPEQQLQALKDKYAQGLTLYSENHPEMRALKKMIASQELAVQKARSEATQVSATDANDPNQSVEARLLAQKLSSIDSNVALLKKQRDALIVSNDRLEDIILKTPQIGADLLSMERRRESLQRSSDEMSAKLAQATLGERMEENQQAERFEVIEAPIVPQEPSRPKRVPLFMLVAGAALGAGGATAVGAEFLGGTVKRSSDLTRKMNQRLLTVVPYIYTRREVRRRRILIIFWIVSSITAVISGLLAIHIFYAPLDILILRFMNTLRSIVS